MGGESRDFDVAASSGAGSGLRRVREAIAPAAQEGEVSGVAQHLELLPDLGADVVVAGIERLEPRLVGVDVVQGELGAADGLDGTHDVHQPAARGRALVAQEEGGAPLVQHLRLGDGAAVADDPDLAGLGHAAEEDVAADPARAPGGGGERLALLDDGLREEVARGTTQTSVTPKLARS